MCLRVGFVLILSIHYNSPKRNEKKDVEQKKTAREPINKPPLSLNNEKHRARDINICSAVQK